MDGKSEQTADTAYYSHSFAQVAEQFQVDPEIGLSSSEAESRLVR